MVPVKLLILGAQNTGKTGRLPTETPMREWMNEWRGVMCTFWIRLDVLSHVHHVKKRSSFGVKLWSRFKWFYWIWQSYTGLKLTPLPEHWSVNVSRRLRDLPCLVLMSNSCLSPCLWGKQISARKQASNTFHARSVVPLQVDVLIWHNLIKTSKPQRLFTVGYYYIALTIRTSVTFTLNVGNMWDCLYKTQTLQDTYSWFILHKFMGVFGLRGV